MKFEKPVSASVLARHLGVSPRTVHNWIRKGSVPAAQLVTRGQFLIPADFANAIVNLVQTGGQPPTKTELS